jgi:hypothetical protein
MHTHMCLETHEMRDKKFFFFFFLRHNIYYDACVFIYLFIIIIIIFFLGTMSCIYCSWVALPRAFFMGHILKIMGWV